MMTEGEGEEGERHGDMDMATMTASLERSLHNASLNTTNTSVAGLPHHHHQAGGGISRTSSSDLQQQQHHHDGHVNENMRTLELNSQIPLPSQWEQCLDLETGKTYYVNWRTGTKTKEHPRMTMAMDTYAAAAGGFYSEEDEEEDEESSYDSEEGSSTESSPSTSTDKRHRRRHLQNNMMNEANNNNIMGDIIINVVDNKNNNQSHEEDELQQQPPPAVLVVAGCKRCLMYFMVPKKVEDCPKCSSQLLHFDK